MRKSRIVQIVGYVLVVIGIIGLLWSIQPTSGTTTGEIPVGAGYYRVIKISFWYSGHVSGDFSSDSGSVHFYILDSAEYAAYSIDGTVTSSLYSTTGVTGAFSVDLPTTSSYYMVWDHGPGQDAILQQITLTYKVTGLDLTYMIAGIVLLVIGVVVSVVGLRMKKKEPALGPTPKPVSDVTTFDSKQQPQPPA